MREDGEVTLYVLEAKYDRKWFGVNLDHFGSPPGFSASDSGWQKTGIHGTFDEAQGVRAVMLMAENHVEYDWRLMRLEISQHHFEVMSVKAKKPGAKSPDWYDSGYAEMRRRCDNIQGGKK